MAAGACRAAWASSAFPTASCSVTSPGISAPARLSHRLAQALDAFTIHQTYSRLVIDCNRDPAVETSIVTVSESTEIPGNGI